MSQENVSDKVRSLQRQIAQSIKFGQKPPSLRKSEGDEGSSDEEESPRSPMKVMAQVETEPAAADVETKAATPVKSPRSRRVLPPEGTIETINLDAVPQPGPRLDNAAAKHKLSVKPKNQRVSRKHRRFTQELQEVNLQDILQEEAEAETTAEESPGPPEHSKKQKLQEDEREQRELRRKREEERLREEERRKAEELRLAEERRVRLEEERRRREEEERCKREEEERMRREEEERMRRELEEKRRKQEEERRIQEERERKMREEEERKRREEEERRRLEAERQRLEEERRIREAEEAVRKEKEEAEKRRLLELEEKRRKEEEEERLREKERRRKEEEQAERKRLAEEEEHRKEEEEKKKQQEERQRASEGRAIEWKRKAEEMRWKEMGERQPFTFKVSSGEKQILFQKVNLTPVTPGGGHQASPSSETGETAKASTSASADSPALSSIYVPHTAILVTDAQLWGPAVNLDQIKDTACKSLLGTIGPAGKPKISPDRKSGKTKSLSLSSTPTDQSSVLAEWATIRSKIFKGVEEGKYEDYLEPTHSRKENQTRPTSEDLNQLPFPHPNLRKTLSASAKFSITPARKKFGDSNRNSEILFLDEQDDRRVELVSPETFHHPGPLITSSSSKNQSRGTKSVRISDSSEECMFAKDLPSFLVPSPNQGSPKLQMPDFDLLSQTDSECSIPDPRDEGDQGHLGGGDRPSPFGIKLRRTNYSLRFHNEQSSEKRKKRYSAGDSFEGVPGPFTPMSSESSSPVVSERSSPTSPLRENVAVKPTPPPSQDSQMKPSRSPVPSVHSDSERFIPRPPAYQKPPTSPKPADVTSPPLSPLIKVGRMPPAGDTGEQRKGSVYSFSSDDRDSGKGDEASTSTISAGEEETKEKKSFFPSISIPWREKDRKAELIRKEKPSLQSRHSLDSSKVQEKAVEAGPLWITLALQKQKGFREQQQTREERKNQREAKLAEKQARERDSGVLSPTEDKGNGNTSPPKPKTPEEGKRPDSLLGRFERRENLKKANTLPSSVTVEITDSTPSPPAVKEVSKRFPPGDSQQVSTEPAWLALAKRKAKAWSDCPQIIK
ncbi:hypothetical protein ACEWY4_014576 [Coilia grayii]|uniref:DUF4592 domain-containing protein n=1 Tax=Coilia grayii TaxID=363190 RepID=A0ABD1JSN3_9TELE